MNAPEDSDVKPGCSFEDGICIKPLNAFPDLEKAKQILAEKLQRFTNLGSAKRKGGNADGDQPP